MAEKDKKSSLVISDLFKNDTLKKELAETQKNRKKYEELMTQKNKFEKGQLDYYSQMAKEYKAKEKELAERKRAQAALAKNELKGLSDAGKIIKGRQIQKEATERVEDWGKKWLRANPELIRAIKVGSDQDVEMIAKSMEKTMKGVLKKEINPILLKNAIDEFKSGLQDHAEKTSSMFYPIINAFEGVADAISETLTKKFPSIFGEHFKEMTSELSGWFKSTVSPILAPIDKLVQPFGIVGKYLMGVGKSLFGRGTTDEPKKQTGWLKKIYSALAFDDPAEKARRLTETENQRRMWMKIIKDVFFLFAGAIAGIFGAVIGGIGKAVYRPFAALFKMAEWLKLPKVIDKVIWIFRGIYNGFVYLTRSSSAFLRFVGNVGALIIELVSPLFKFIGKIAGYVRSFMGGLSAFFSGTGKFISFLSSISKYIGPFGKTMSLFLKLSNPIGWIITVVMGVLDFIKGWKATSGSLAKKLMGGLKQVVIGFFEIPIKAIGWVVDKILGWFGIKIKGGYAGWVIGRLSAFFDFLGNALDWIVRTMGKIWEDFKGIFNVKELGAWINRILVDPLMNFFNWLGEIFNIKEWIKKAAGLIVDRWPFLASILPTTAEAPELGKNVPETNTGTGVEVAKANATGKQVEQTAKTNENVEKTNQSLTKINQANQQTNNTIVNAVNSMQRANEKDEIPTDVENLGILFMNSSWGLA